MRINHVLGALTIAVAVLLPSHQAAAHAFWVNLADYYLNEAGESTRAYIGWGHRVPADEALDADRLDQYALVAPDGSCADLMPNPGGFLVAQVRCDTTGPHVVTASRVPGFFTVWEEGGETRYGAVPMTGLENVASSSYNEMYGKALLGVQAHGEDDFTTPVGAVLEVVPLKNPATLSPGPASARPALPVQVLFRGEPRPGAEISATYVGFSTGLEYAQSTETDADGKAAFEMSTGGIWIVHAFTSTELREDFQGKAHGENYHATLTFEMPRFSE